MTFFFFYIGIGRDFLDMTSKVGTMSEKKKVEEGIEKINGMEKIK